MDASIVFAGLTILGILLFFVILSLFPFRTYIKCLSAGVPASPVNLVAMNLRRVPTDLIVDQYVRGTKGGIALRLDFLEAHNLAGGDVEKVVSALISAARAKLTLTFARAAAIDLAGRDVLDAVRMRVEPRVISAGPIQGMAADGIEVIVRAKITVRANLDTMVGGAGEETIVARVSEGIVSAIGSTPTHKEVIKAPELITKKIMSMGLDSGSAFEIISFDVADVDVGRNIGAILQNDQAEADKKVGKAKAEGRRALAVAQTQENKALEQEMKAKLVDAERKVPIALSNCFKAGKIVVPRKKKSKASAAPALGFGVDNG